MTKYQRVPLLSPRTIEFALLLLIVPGLVYNVYFLTKYGYLPPPFIFDPSDTMMDWFNTTYWAVNSREYDIWNTIYPPLSFDFLKLFSIHSCYSRDAFVGRDCDWVGRWTILSFFAANLYLVFKAYRIVDKRTAAIRAAAVCFGLPMLYTLERGNLILPCFTCFVLAHSRVLKSTRLKWLAIALSINFKPYLLAALAPAVLRARWRWLEGALLTTLIVFLASYAALGAGAPQEMLKNMMAYVVYGGNNYFGAVYYGASYTSISKFLQYGVPIMSMIGSRPMEFMEAAAPILIRIGQAGVLAAFGLAAVRPHAIPVHRLAALGVAFALTSTEFGGYAEVFLLFLVFLEPWRGAARVSVLVIAYILCVPTDFVLFQLSHQLSRSYLTQRVVGNDLSVTLGVFVRPGLVLIIEYVLSAATIIELWRGRGASWVTPNPLVENDAYRAPA